MTTTTSTTETPSWRNTFNSDIASFRWGYQGYAQDAARSSGYPYYAWNGWVYRTTEDNWSETGRVVLAETLK